MFGFIHLSFLKHLIQLATKMSISFYEPDGDGFFSTQLTRGPWRDAHQHGGPPAALLARSMELAFAPARLVRITLGFLRPIPITRLSIATEIIRSGKRSCLLASVLLADGTPVCHALGLLLQPRQVTLEAHASSSVPPCPVPSPEQCPPFSFPFFESEIGYHRAVELRLARGRFGGGKVAMWMRPTMRLIATEETSPAQRALILADSSSGIAMLLPPQRYTFLNADLTLYLHRAPQSPWLCLDATTVAQPDGIGLVESALFDETGAVGRAVQSLVIEERSSLRSQPAGNK